MAKQTFTSGQVLTAAQVNALQGNDFNQTVTTKTASYTPTTNTDIGTRVIMNSASATTITINTSIYSAGDTFFISNIGAGVCTLTAGTCAITSAGPLAIPQYGGGTLYFTSASAAIYYSSAGPTASSGLTLITAQTITASSSFQINNCFSATYDNYLVKMFISAATTGINLKLRLGTSGTPDTGSIYTAIFSVVRNLTGVGVYNDGSFNASSLYFNLDNYIPAFYDIDIQNPFAARPTGFIIDNTSGATAAETQKYTGGGNINNTTSFTDINIFPASGTITGLIKIYGYANS
ncbi:hypothetical protein UFOVP1639_25 [uncultured Caudovirales phage]|uniref:Uncharacterized protein n=1 Tax=uncultured Caudovirales phage TaxID=2100421 RepID=A0A6J5SWS2_9CAUD|nr:hypothetical protein UFOVP1639_25 [uncultured Caudovirales phage]